MITEVAEMMTEVVASDDGKDTYEVRRVVDNGMTGQAIIVELYPTLTVDTRTHFDLSTMHLMNHMNMLGWREVRVINLFSSVFSSKPLSHQLHADDENLAYMEKILSDNNIRNYDIVICWGTTLQSNAAAREMKKAFLKMVTERHLEEQLKEITVDELETNDQISPHPLYLGLRHAKDEWYLQKYTIPKLLRTKSEAEQTTASVDSKSKRKKSKKKVESETQETVEAEKEA